MAKAKAAIRVCTVRLVVPFYDLDPLHVVWHGNYFRYFEHARQALFDQSGMDLYSFAFDSGYLFPVTKCSIKHVHPLRFRDEFEVEARLLEARHRIVVEFEVRKLPEGLVCARGVSEQVAVEVPGMKLLLDIPGEIRTALERGR